VTVARPRDTAPLTVSSDPMIGLPTGGRSLGRVALNLEFCRREVGIVHGAYWKAVGR